ncbi:MAG: helix-turn-helix transcriptional regulator [Desulfoprunum sp.]|jgi:HTH-type transcriptional regulator/antitoxin HipB|uniref:helix-turn-helix domain-containing protein n=1 Tax=Desulfoprunum sp. TaxID=2020866 RepID=UPI00052C908A|nr:transcriptional regulator [Desulfobulbus sp. Tol-SR]
MQTLLVSSNDLGAVLRDLRRQQGLTQAELGRRVGLDQKKVSLLENGNSNCRIDSLFRLLSALGVGVVVQPKVELQPADKDDW